MPSSGQSWELSLVSNSPTDLPEHALTHLISPYTWLAWGVLGGCTGKLPKQLGAVAGCCGFWSRHQRLRKKRGLCSPFLATSSLSCECLSRRVAIWKAHCLVVVQTEYIWAVYVYTYIVTIIPRWSQKVYMYIYIYMYRILNIFIIIPWWSL